MSPGQYMNLQFLCQRAASDKKSFDFQDFSRSAGAKMPLPRVRELPDKSGARTHFHVQ